MPKLKNLHGKYKRQGRTLTRLEDGAQLHICTRKDENKVIGRRTREYLMWSKQGGKYRYVSSLYPLKNSIEKIGGFDVYRIDYLGSEYVVKLDAENCFISKGKR